MLNPSLLASAAKQSREGTGLAIVRWLIGTAFLFAAFNEFPEHKWSIGLGLLIFDLGVSAIASIQTTYYVAANLVLDASERKTRHAILLAAESVGMGEIDQIDFWATVNDRVENEFGEHEPLSLWKSAGLISGAVAWRLASDLFGIALVVALTS